MTATNTADDLEHFIRKAPPCTCSHHDWQHGYLGRCLADTGDTDAGPPKKCECTKYTPQS